MLSFDFGAILRTNKKKTEGGLLGALGSLNFLLVFPLEKRQIFISLSYRALSTFVMSSNFPISSADEVFFHLSEHVLENSKTLTEVLGHFLLLVLFLAGLYKEGIQRHFASWLLRSALPIFKKKIFNGFREREEEWEGGRGRERREKHQLAASHMHPNWGSNLQPGYVS